MALPFRLEFASARSTSRCKLRRRPSIYLIRSHASLTRINPAADEPAKKAADALVVALNEEEIVAELKEQNPQNTQESKIALNVGTKP